MIQRIYTEIIRKKLFLGKAILLLGARQVGKTTLLRALIQQRPDALFLNCDEPEVQRFIETASSSRIQAFFGNKKLIVLDEAQQIVDIGLKIKLMVDTFPEFQIIASGSSSFDLVNATSEPLTGRKWQYQVFPLSFQEMTAHHGLLEERKMLMHRLVFGYYPEVVAHPGQEKELLPLIGESYLYKDILRLEQIKKTDALVRLLQAIAYQVGSQVSYAELAQVSGIDAKTVEKYISVLEKAFVIFRLSSFSRNLRNELKFSKKIYFYDNGLRNTLINNLNPAENRNDIGVLWENFLISERLKYNHINGSYAQQWFWRTRQQNEIDLLEEKDGKLKAYEFKWNPKAKVKISKQFQNQYPDVPVKVIHRDNIEEFIL